jgi:D-alanyl-lipoteichoic acid acyltransferase DltB (MBOAT superfamily)
VAIGAALLLGFRLPENFNRPYQSTDLQDFWRRWHISLSSWLRDYLYVPLGGNRGGTVMTYRNLFLTMLLGGLWHGAAWTFVVWGALHGTALAVVRAFQRTRKARYERRGQPVPEGSVVRKVVGVLLTFHFVCFCWIFFRAPSFEAAGAVLQTLAQGTAYVPNLTPKILTALAIGLGVHFSPVAWRDRAREHFIATPAWARGVALFVLAVVLQQIKGTDVVPFIYFQF